LVLDDDTGAAILVRHYEEWEIRGLMQAMGVPVDEAAAGSEIGGATGSEGARLELAESAPLAGPVRIAAGAVEAPSQFSVSALMCFSHCARWYLYEYVYRLGRIPRGLRNAFGAELQLNAAVRGQVVHSVCERCDRATDSAQARALLLDELHLRGADSVLAGSVADELMPMIDIFLTHYPGPMREGQKEIGFLMDVGGPIVSGVMDRVDVLSDGSVLVVDFKTNRVLGPSVDEAAARYAVQLDAYAVAAGRVYNADRVTARLHFLYPDEVRDRSYGPAELLQAAEDLKKLADEASRYDLRNAPIRRIPECNRCYFAQLCGFTAQDPCGFFDDSPEDEDDISPAGYAG
jgi:RecB family exonuclease